MTFIHLLIYLLGEYLSITYQMLGGVGDKKVTQVVLSLF